MIEIIRSIVGYLTQEHIEPPEWDVSDMTRVIEEYLIPYPEEQERRELYIPVVYAFSRLFLRKGFITMYEQVVSETESANVRNIESGQEGPSEIILKEGENETLQITDPISQ